MILRIRRDINLPADVKLKAVVTNPYNDSIDLILEHPSFDALPDFAVAPVFNAHTEVGPQDWAMSTETGRISYRESNLANRPKE